jgi:hypothetical protein
MTTSAVVMAKSLNIIEDVEDILQEADGQVDQVTKLQCTRQVDSVRHTLTSLCTAHHIEPAPPPSEASLMPLRNCISYLNSDVIPPLGRIIRSSEKWAQLRPRVHKLQADVESVTRTVDIIALPTSAQEERRPTLMWAADCGTGEHLELLVQTKELLPADAKELAESAVAEISERVSEEHDPEHEIRDFFCLGDREFALILSNLSWTNALPHSLQEYTPIKTLRIIREKLRRVKDRQEVERWLKAPNVSFDARSPLEAIQSGEAFSVLQLLTGSEEGVFD